MPNEINPSNLDNLTIETVQRIQAEAIEGIKVRFRDITLPRAIKDAAHEGQTAIIFNKNELPKYLDLDYVDSVFEELKDKGFNTNYPNPKNRRHGWWTISWGATKDEEE